MLQLSIPSVRVCSMILRIRSWQHLRYSCLAAFFLRQERCGVSVRGIISIMERGCESKISTTPANLRQEKITMFVDFRLKGTNMAGFYYS